MNFEINKRIELMLIQRKIEGEMNQDAFDWSNSLLNWLKNFPLYGNFLTTLVNPIGREDLRKFFNENQFPDVEKFLAVMVWGYGDRGYGPYRVKRIMESENFLESITECIRLCRIRKPVEAYQHLSAHRIIGLGPSFGTKLISFATPYDTAAPIYDSFVAKWIISHESNAFREVSTNPGVWNPKLYQRYVDWVDSHAQFIGCNPDQVELAIFEDAIAQFSKRSSWGS